MVYIIVYFLYCSSALLCCFGAKKFASNVQISLEARTNRLLFLKNKAAGLTGFSTDRFPAFSFAAATCVIPPQLLDAAQNRPHFEGNVWQRELGSQGCANKNCSQTLQAAGHLRLYSQDSRRLARNFLWAVDHCPLLSHALMAALCKAEPTQYNIVTLL